MVDAAGVGYGEGGWVNHSHLSSTDGCALYRCVPPIYNIYGRTGGCCHKVLACLYPDYCRISRKAGVKINKLVLLSCTILPMSICYIQKIVSSLELLAECCNNINLFLLSRPSDERRSQYMKCQNVSLSYDETKMTCTGYPAAC